MRGNDGRCLFCPSLVSTSRGDEKPGDGADDRVSLARNEIFKSNLVHEEFDEAHRRCLPL